ncbi:hypothetical protein [Noviherbaspirillum sedimenti]|uniref:Glycine zipper domain-containing protein n=1 Tax=Noviherbaspirillum sedimenti TaxID=2320865 RepID=A0A3A3G7F9_9BURK|nr:hypothetical protein [Noviherbaspirillum sedimenti]RJG04447.1 hypothetical protein D3878_14990 [Noviherbaspirillum sedimenti]
MSTIIAGRFDQQAGVEEARAELLRAGFSEEQVTSFYVNPPGQHDLTPVGGDEIESPGAEHSRHGLAQGGVAGGVVGAALGTAGIPVLGPVGPLVGAMVGAHIGDLAGSLSEMDDDGGSGNTAGLPYRRSGMLLAILADDPDAEDRAIRLLRALHAQDIERAQGTIANGDWEDFNPLQPPSLVDMH